MRKITEQEKRTAKSFASLSIGLWTVSLIGYLTSGISWHTYFLVVVGTLFSVFGLYLILPWDWKQKQYLQYLEAHQIMKVTELLGWLVVLMAFVVRLIQSKVGWLIVIGLTITISAFVIFLAGLSRTGNHNGKEKQASKYLPKSMKIEEVQSMGSKGRKNVKKAKKTQEKKPEAGKK